MAADLPNEFDVIVLGSGMPESIVAAAFARIGQSVLHLDRNEYYSGDWASFNLQGIEKWAQQLMGTECNGEETCSIKRPQIDEKALLEDGEYLLELPLENRNFTNVDLQFHTKQEEETEETTIADIPHPKERVSCKDSIVSSVDEDKHKESVDTCLEKSEVLGESADVLGIGHVDSSRTTGLDIKLESLEVSKKPVIEAGAGQTDEQTELIKNVQSSETTNIVNSEEKQKSDNVLKTDDDSATNTETNESSKHCETGKSSDNSKSVIETEHGCESETVKEGSGPKTWTQKSLKAEWRRFNLDLSPKVLYCGGKMVELLISSDIAKYCEFKTVTRILTVMDGKVEKVPCSRADVFSSKRVSMLEKRMLMKFLQFCLEFQNKTEEIKDFLDKPFTEFLSSRKLTENLKHFVQHSIAMATDNMSTQEGLERTQKFLQSVGRYGNTAFLWSLYGSGELPQSFCRMCAVFGGIYCLRMSASSLILDKDNRCRGIVTTEGQRIACKWLIMESSYASEVFISSENKRFISRGIIVADKPLLPSETETQELSLLCLPCPDDGNRPVFVLELPPGSMACPPELYIFHLTRQSKDGSSPEEDLAYALDVLFHKENGADEEPAKPRILWSTYFTQKDNSNITASERLPDNVFLLSGPGVEIDIDRPVQEARELFKKILPDEEFLPKAPNPEDIIYVDDSETKVSEDSSQSEFGDKDTDQSQSSKDGNQTEMVEQDSHQSELSKDNIQSGEPVKDRSQSEDETQDTKHLEQLGNSNTSD